MRTLIALVLLSAPAFAAPVPKELRNAPRVPRTDAPRVPRTEVVIDESEDTWPLGEILRRIWYGDTPSRLTPDRIHGGIL